MYETGPAIYEAGPGVKAEDLRTTAAAGEFEGLAFAPRRGESGAKLPPRGGGAVLECEETRLDACIAPSGRGSWAASLAIREKGGRGLRAVLNCSL